MDLLHRDGKPEIQPSTSLGAVPLLVDLSVHMFCGQASPLTHSAYCCTLAAYLAQPEPHPKGDEQNTLPCTGQTPQSTLQERALVG